MQIQEVSDRTGLTKRTIRFYIEKELIDPRVVERNGKDYREYSDSDIRMLLTIAELRKALFSIEQIKEMLDRPETIPVVIEAYRKELVENHENLTRLMKVMEDFKPDRVHDLFDLSRAVSDVSKDMQLPRLDVTPHFARFDPRPTAPEKEMPAPVRYFSRGFALFLAAVILLSAGIGLFSWNRRTLNPTFAGEAYHLVNLDGGIVCYRNDSGRIVRISQAGVYPRWTDTELVDASRAYQTYQIDTIEANGARNTYGYRATNSPEVWLVGDYDLYGFTLPAIFTVAGHDKTVTQYDAIPTEIRFVMDCITAYRNYRPLYTAFLPFCLAVPGAFVFWFFVWVWGKGRLKR